ncbi:MAG: MFS transporter, partial [Rhodospirillum sp.]|nr:MFS transporter [Rhodospirillum sp.]
MNPRTLLLFLIALLVGSDEFLLGPILTPIGRDLGVSPERVTLFIGAYALPLALLAPLLGHLSDQYGRRALLFPSVLLFCLGSLLTAAGLSYTLALVGRVVTGIGAAGMLPLAFAMAADGGGHRVAKGVAAVQAGLTSGIIFAPLYGAWATDALGWRAAFATLGILAGLIAVGCGVSGLGSRATVAKTPDLPPEPWPPGATGALLAMGLGLGGAIGVYALVGERLRRLGDLETGWIGLIYAGFGLLTLLGNVAMPVAMGRVGDGRRLMRWCLGGVLVAIVVVFALSPSVLIVCLPLAIWAFLGGLGAPGLQTHLAGLSEAKRGV